MSRLFATTAACALLAACGQRAPAPSNEASGNAVDSAAPAPADNAAAPATPPFAETPGAHPTAPEPAPVPAKFRGTWAETKALCADLKHHSRLTISGRTLRFPTFVIVSDTVDASGNQFSLKGKIEGTNKPAEAQYFVSADGNTLTDGGGGGASRVRCG